MSIIDLSIEERGFEPNSVAIALRTIGSCYAMRFPPDSRVLCGIGLLSVTVRSGNYTFETTAKVLADGETPANLLDWLEARLPAEVATVSWDNWGSVPIRLIALADPLRHPRICTAAIDVAGRWRALPRSYTWHLRQTQANTMPCMCAVGCSISDCQPQLPSFLLPDAAPTQRQLIEEAIAGWRCWAQGFGDFDDDQNPAQRAISAFAHWNADGRPGASTASPR